jgi:hypothetical protein
MTSSILPWLTATIFTKDRNHNYIPPHSTINDGAELWQREQAAQQGMTTKIKEAL